MTIKVLHTLQTHIRVRTAMRERLSLLMLSIVALMCIATQAKAQSSGGGIAGRVVAVTTERRAPQAGVIVTLEGDILRGRTLQTVSDDEGAYAFGDLIAGDYVIGVALQGFEKFEQRVSVQIGARADLNIFLKAQALSENVTVTAQGDEVRTTESSLPSEIGTRTLRNAPLANERFQDALPLVPGVVRAADGSLAIKGARSSQSGLLVSSLNVTDPVTGNSAINLPLEAVDTIQVYANPYSAEFGKFTGAVTSIETRSGSNQFRYLLTNVLPRPRLREGKIYGIQATTPRIAVGGPIVKDKLFFFQTLEYRFVRTEVTSLPAAERDTKLESFDSFTRLDYNINPTNRLTVSFSLFPQKLDFFNLNTFNARDTTANIHQRGYFFAVNEQSVFGSGALLQSAFSVKEFDVDVFGNSGQDYFITPDRNTGGFFDRQNRNSRRYELLETFSLPALNFGGAHNVRFGANFTYTQFDGSDISQPVRVVRGDGSLSQLIRFVGDGSLSRNAGEQTFFVQDKWTPNTRLTLDFGLRYDRDGIGRDNNFAPRVGFVVLPFDDARTIIRGGIGLFYDKIPLGVGTFEQRQSLLVTQFAPNGVTIGGAPTLYRNVVANDDFKNPRSIAGNIQVDRELTKDVLFRIGYAERHTSRDFIVEPLTLVAGDGVLLLSNSGSSRYRELEITGQYRLRERQNLNLSYVHSRAVGDLNDFDTYFGNVRNPVIRSNEFSRLSFDAPHRLLFTGNIGLPRDFTLSPVVDWRSGFPFSILDENQNYVGRRNLGGRFPQFVSMDLQVTKGVKIPVPGFRFIPQKFRGKDIGGRVGIKIFNITNHFNPRDVQNNIDSEQYGTFYNTVRRSFRAKFEFVKF